MAALKKNQYDAYKDTEITTANQGKLIIMLYDGALRFLKIANENMSPRTYDVVNTNIIKAQDIVTELMLALNMDEGGEVAENLFNLYAYMKKRLLEANIAKDTAVVDEVLGILNQLKGAWSEVAAGDGKGAAPAAKPAQSSTPREGMSFSISG
ncbi:MAG: flagellar export chaperone FliS [bacterium]|nr:flagellar export chaperone FliS [bacterium]